MAPMSFTLLFAAFLLLAVGPPMNNADDHTERPLFTYHGSHGPFNWGKLNPNFTRCSSGKLQSPVNITRKQTVINKNLKPLIEAYIPANATLLTNGVNVGIHFESDCGSMDIDSKKYTLKQLHWHSPSEHMIDGIQYPLELHMVHQLEDNNYSVVAVLYHYGEADPFIAKIEKSLERLAEEVKAGDKEAKVPLGMFHEKLLKKYYRRFYRYVGSLTTPPCTEQVLWNIISEVRTVSKQQIEVLKAPLNRECKNNCRPVQSLNGRQVEIAPRS